jgi:hypothetical protein
MSRCASSKELKWTERRRWMRRCPRSSGISARARSCGSASASSGSISRPFRPARSASTSRSASAVCRAAGWSRSTARNPRARPRSRCTPSPRRRRRAAPAPSSMPSTRSIRSMPASSGVNIDDLLISQPDAGEQALEIADTLVRSGAIDVLVIDSVAALDAARRTRGRDGRRAAGLQARLMSQALRKLTSRSRAPIRW